jgi:hypothetical protein
MRNVSDKSCEENENVHFMFHNFFFLRKLTVCDLMSKNVVEPERRQMAVQYGAYELHAG